MRTWMVLAVSAVACGSPTEKGTDSGDFTDGLGEFGTHEDSGHPDAPVLGRVVTSDAQGDQLQVLIDFDRALRTFTFRAGNPPGVLAYAHNTHTIVDLGDGRSRVEIDVVIVPKGVARLLKGKIQSRFTAYMEAYLDEAQAAIERPGVS